MVMALKVTRSTSLGSAFFCPQHFLHMPADRLALAIGVGGEDQAVGGLGEIGDRLQLACLVAIIFPGHREAVIGIDRAVLGGQIADMPVGRQDPIVPAQIFLDGLGLGRRSDDDELQIDARKRRYAYTRGV